MRTDDAGRRMEQEDKRDPVLIGAFAKYSTYCVCSAALPILGGGQSLK